MSDRIAYRSYVERHRAYVLDEAIALGIPDRGLTHDLSKFTPEEFGPYAEYFYGGHERGKVPADVQDAFDLAWLLHQKRNDHHHQYWLLHQDDGTVKALEMPGEAVREMVADWRGAGRAIRGESADTVGWYRQNKGKMVLHATTRALVEHLLGYGG